MHNNVTVAKIMYISICVEIIKWLLQVKQPDLFSLHYVSNNWCYLLALLAA